MVDGLRPGDLIEHVEIWDGKVDAAAGPPFRLLALDIDGALLRSSRDVSARMRAAIARGA